MQQLHRFFTLFLFCLFAKDAFAQQMDVKKRPSIPIHFVVVCASESKCPQIPSNRSAVSASQTQNMDPIPMKAWRGQKDFLVGLIRKVQDDFVKDGTPQATFHLGEFSIVTDANHMITDTSAENLTNITITLRNKYGRSNMINIFLVQSLGSDGGMTSPGQRLQDMPVIYITKPWLGFNWFSFTISHEMMHIMGARHISEYDLSLAPMKGQTITHEFKGFPKVYVSKISYPVYNAYDYRVSLEGGKFDCSKNNIMNITNSANDQMVKNVVGTYGSMNHHLALTPCARPVLFNIDSLGNNWGKIYSTMIGAWYSASFPKK